MPGRSSFLGRCVVDIRRDDAGARAGHPWGRWEFTPTLFGDARGIFLETFKASEFEKITGRSLNLMQANCSVSAAGVLRGIHYTDNPPGQAKYVTCLRGAFLDVIIDLRIDSPTYGTWDSVLLDDEHRRIVFPVRRPRPRAALAVGRRLDRHILLHAGVLAREAPTMTSTRSRSDRLAITWPTVARNGHPLTITPLPQRRRRTTPFRAAP